MNILVFSWRDPKHPLAGGAEQVMHEHFKGWIKTGHRITLFSSRFKNSEKEETLDGVKIIRGGHQYLGVQMSGFFYYLKNKDEFDLVIDQFHGIPFFTPLFVQKPKLVVVQETTREVWFLNPLPIPLNFIVGFLGFIAEPFIFLIYKNQTFMTGSQSAKEEISKFGISKKQITVIPHGVIVKKPKPLPKEKIKTLVYLGVLSKDKGIEDAIKCFSILDNLGKFNFWVIGRPETEEYNIRLMKEVNKLNFKNKIKFWGFVPIRKKFELLARAHLLVNPSIREGWGLVNIEANTVGTPVIAYHSPGLVDSVSHNFSGLICEQNTPKDLAGHVLRLFRNNNSYDKVRRGAISWSNNFSWGKSIKKSLNLIHKKSLYVNN